MLSKLLEKKLNKKDEKKDEGRRLSISISESNITSFAMFNHVKEITRNIWHPKKNVLATGSFDGTVRLWDLTDNDLNPKQTILNHFSSKDDTQKMFKITSIDWNNDGNLLASTTSYDSDVTIWSRVGEQQLLLEKHTKPVNCVKWNKSGNHLVSCGEDKSAVIWSAATGRCLQQFRYHTNNVLDVDWQSDKVFATCSTDKTIQVCKLYTGSPVTTFSGHTDCVITIQWHDQKHILASGSCDKSIKVWTLGDSGCLETYNGHTNFVHTVKWKPVSPYNPGLILASACFDCVKLWDISQNVCLYDLNSEPAKGNSRIAFSPDGKYVAGGTFCGLVRIWKTQSGQLVYKVKGRDPIFDVAWNSRGDKLSVVTAGRDIYVFDIRRTPSVFSTTIRFI